MGWFGNFLGLSGGSGSSRGGDIDDADPRRDGHRRRRRSTILHHRYGDGSNLDRDDLFLSDDDDEDDWGMSSVSATARKIKTNMHHHHYNDRNVVLEDDDDDDEFDHEQRRRGRRQKFGRRSSSSGSSAFWDQTSTNDGTLSGGNNHGGLAPRENTVVDDDAFHGQKYDSYYDPRHDRAGAKRGVRGDSTRDYLEHENPGGAGGEDQDDNVSSTSSNKEEVANAYRDYLKSIRDGGFEIYLDNTTAITAEGGKSYNNHNNVDEDGALERVLDMEEERASGSIYGDLYGVHDVRGMASSPYSEWRAKAKALLRQEEKLDKNRMMGGGKAGSSSPSRKVLDRFRRKRRAGSSGGRGGVGGNHRMQYAGEDDGHVDVYYDTGIPSRFYGYRVAVFRHPLFRGICVLLCVFLGFGVGISYYYMRTPAHEESSSTASGVASGMTEHGINSITELNNTSQNKNSRPSDAILNALSTFEPVWFDRRTGWEGITFMNAVHFCASHKDRVPCPYEIYCNKDDGTPYNGIRPGGEQWAAISNGANQWVQVGEIFTCQRYTDLHDRKKPEWGITGVSPEHEHGAGGITQNIMCCVDVYRIGSLDPFTQWGKNDEMENAKEDSTKETTDSSSLNLVDTDREENPNKGNVAVASKNSDEQNQEKAVIAAFEPIWFSNTHGWSGKSYEDAVLFCESYNQMVLCPYAAYCPNGHAHPPLPGSMISEVEGEQWAPANGPMNTWVQIGTVGGDESTRCSLHQEVLGVRPEWGIDGTRSELKHHILCCSM